MANNKQLKSQIIEYGKVPPQAVDLEEAVLGALLLEKDAYIEVSELLQPESFYKNAHQTIYEAISTMHNTGQQVDMMTVVEQLKKMNVLDEVGGVYYISQLTNRVASATHIETHAKIIVQKHLKRQLIKVTAESNTNCYSEEYDIDELISTIQNNISLIDSSVGERGAEDFNKLLAQADGEYLRKEANYSEDSISGVPTGFPKLDRITGGWQKTDLIVLAARPSMGKTAFALVFARRACEHYMRMKMDDHVLMYSLEMGRIQLVNRHVSSADIDPSHIRDGNMTPEEKVRYNKFVNEFRNMPMIIDDKAGASDMYILNRSKKIASKKKIGLIIIDYLQLVTGSIKGGTRENEVSSISRNMKILAKELEVPVIALSQLSRKIEDRPVADRIPELSDLRESGAIEQDADMVIFPLRPGKYGITEDEEGRPIHKHEGMVYIKKHRNGSLGEVAFQGNDYMSEIYEKGKVPIEIQEVETYNPNEMIEPNNDFSNGNYNEDDLPF